VNPGLPIPTGDPPAAVLTPDGAALHLDYDDAAVRERHADVDLVVLVAVGYALAADQHVVVGELLAQQVQTLRSLVVTDEGGGGSRIDMRRFCPTMCRVSVEGGRVFST